MENLKIFIGGLNYQTNESRLEEIFSSFGKIVNLRIVRDHETGNSRGYAFITYDSVDAVEKARSLDGERLDGRIIGVKIAVDKRRI